MLRSGISLLMMLCLPLAVLVAESNESVYLMNYDLIITHPDGNRVLYQHKQFGIDISPQHKFHGDELGEMDYFFTISELENQQGKLTIEVYQFENRNKELNTISEIIMEADFTVAGLVRTEARNNNFGIDLAFSIYLD